MPSSPSSTEPGCAVAGRDVRSAAEKNDARLFVISGPAGVGKGTLVSRVHTAHPEVYVSVSVTTRFPRPGEVDGTHYHFVSDVHFDELIASDGLLEWAEVHGAARYGTPRGPVCAALDAGRPVILEIDVQGAMQVRQVMPTAVLVFIAPPTWDTLVNRLRGRGAETEEQIARRLVTARHELTLEDEFDKVIVNDELDTAVTELVEFIGL
ncbi:MAG: guanylate kinase [Propionibacteriaceae bacterium]|jgi:guanylate kinase|nr:guanylate kinase [Propionibacteriaceae bacterium]